MAHKLISQIVFTGTRIVGRSFMAAYKQAQASSQYQRAQAKANPNGGGSTMGAGFAGGMTIDEACHILHVKAPKEGTTHAEVLDRYKKLFDQNNPEKGGSFYLQSKIVRARERLETEIKPIAEAAEAEAEVKEGFKPKIYKD